MDGKKQILLVSTIVGFLSGCATLYAQIKSASVKHLAIQALERGSNLALSSKQPPQNAIATSEPPHTSTKIRDIIKAKKADTFVGSWNVLPAEDRFYSVCFASVISLGMGCITTAAFRNGKLVEDLTTGFVLSI